MIFGVAVFLAFTSSVMSLECLTCFDTEESSPCTTSVKCSPGLDRCAVANIGGTAYRSCNIQTVCDFSPSIECCDNDGCNVGSAPSVSGGSSGSGGSGLKCYQCYDAGSPCTNLAPCTLGFDRCAIISVTVSETTSTVRLCTVDSGQCGKSVGGTTTSCCATDNCNSGSGSGGSGAQDVLPHKTGIAIIGSLTALYIMIIKHVAQ